MPEILNDGIDEDCDGSNSTASASEPASWSLIKMLYP